jgi:drug/metabolite transporter (DMT)-like permease
MASPDRRIFGLVLVTAAAVFWSTAGFFVRLLEMDVWTMLAWRSLFAALALAAIVVFQSGRNTVQAVTRMGMPGLAAIPIAVVSMGAYVVALKLTTVANVMVIYATAPFVAAGISYLWIGERISRHVKIASAAALLGVAVMAGSATHATDIAGNALSFLMTVAFSAQLVMARKYPALEMSSVNAIAAAICALLCWPLMSAVLPSPMQLVLLALFGITTTALAYLLFLTGGRHIPSGEAALIGILDVILAPLWLWIAFSEHPGQAALTGGAIVLAAVTYYLSRTASSTELQ